MPNSSSAAVLTQKLRSCPPRLSIATDFQTNEARLQIGQRIKLERIAVSLSVSPTQLFAMVNELPTFSWAAAAFIGNNPRITIGRKLTAIRQACQMIDSTRSPGAVTAKINTLYEGMYRDNTFNDDGITDTTPTIVANNVARHSRQLGWDRVPADQFKLLASAVTGVRLGLPYNNFLIEWQQPGRAAPGNPVGQLVAVDVIHSDAFAQHEQINQAVIDSAQAGLTDIQTVVRMQVLADFDQQRLVGPLLSNYAFLNSDNIILMSVPTLSNVGQAVSGANANQNVLGQAFINSAPALFTLMYAGMERVQRRELPLGPNSKAMSYELDITPVLELDKGLN